MTAPTGSGGWALRGIPARAWRLEARPWLHDVGMKIERTDPRNAWGASPCAE